MPDETTPTTTTAPVVTSPTTNVTTTAAKTDEPPATVPIPVAQLTEFVAMQARLAHMEAEQSQREAAARAEQLKVLAAKGDVEAAMRTQREDSEKALNTERMQRSQSEDRAKRYARDAELSRALSSQPLVPGGAEQLAQLWGNQLVVEPHGDSYVVRTPTFQNVGDFVAANWRCPTTAISFARRAAAEPDRPAASRRRQRRRPMRSRPTSRGTRARRS
jgi:hypothetical protein